MFSKNLYSPLRYPGGKAVFAPFIADVMEKNGLSGGHYVEPYAGGAGVALYLLFRGYAEHIHINDADPAIYDFWISVTQHSSDLLALLESTPITIEEWFKWRSILRGEVSASIAERGFATLFMNRTNRSGILKAGVIGGKGQSGNYKLDARFKKDTIREKIQAISRKSVNISVYGDDCLDFLRTFSRRSFDRSFIYLDPPYYVKGKGLYRNYYDHDDHAAIAKEIQSDDFKSPWVVSYDRVEEISTMYQSSQSLEYGINYSAQKRYVGNEVMFFSCNISIPSKEKIQCKV